LVGNQHFEHRDWVAGWLGDWVAGAKASSPCPSRVVHWVAGAKASAAGWLGQWRLRRAPAG
jgi:hypothetical protein